MTPERRRPASPRPLLALLLFAATLALLAGSTSGAGGEAAAAAPARFGPAVLAELNRVRAQHGLPAVAPDRRMNRAASTHSRGMARRGYIFHGAWGGRVARAAGSPAAVGEVIGWLRRSSPGREARGVVAGWLRSPTHRHVLLDGTFRRVGIGRAPGRVSGQRAALYTVDWASAR